LGQLEKGRVKETTAANVFLVKDGVLLTPATSEGLLAGVTRDLVLDLARRLPVDVEERPLAIEELAAAEEVLVSGSVNGLRAVESLDGRQFSGPIPGPVTQRLQAAYAELVATACA
jgi:branched-subunit amino acid aminotransferase/4-amino-4-deoxychorismate lyase